jgi:hypothetical protein
MFTPLSLFLLFDHAPQALNPLVLFGLYCIMIGYLIVNAQFLPTLANYAAGAQNYGAPRCPS